MTGKMLVFAHGIWTYQKTSEVLAAAGLRTIEHYVRVRRARILHWVKDRPIYKLCQTVISRRVTPPRKFWWEFPMHLDEVAGAQPAVLADVQGGGSNPCCCLGQRPGVSPPPPSNGLKASM